MFNISLQSEQQKINEIFVIAEKLRSMNNADWTTLNTLFKMQGQLDILDKEFPLNSENQQIIEQLKRIALEKLDERWNIRSKSTNK